MLLVYVWPNKSTLCWRIKKGLSLSTLLCYKWLVPSRISNIQLCWNIDNKDFLEKEEGVFFAFDIKYQLFLFGSYWQHRWPVFVLFQKLLQMWIKYQSMEDKDRDKFLDSVWAIAKISSSTDQVNQLVTGLVKKVRVIYVTKSCPSVCNVLYNIIMLKLVQKDSVFT